MANRDHEKRLLEEDAEKWNAWRWANLGVRPDLVNANLVGADLQAVNLNGARLSGANLSTADLRIATLNGADLSGASLQDAGLLGASLIGADLSYANLLGTYLEDTHLKGTHLNGAILGSSVPFGAGLCITIFANVNLSEAKEIEQCHHRGPSIMDRRTLARSGPLPLAFLRGCGLSDWEIEAAKLHQTSLSEQEIINITYRIADLKIQNPVGYQSCFISYTDSDRTCAEKLYAALQEEGVRCWFAPEDLKIGDRIQPRIDEAIYGHQKLLLLLSASSMNSTWVKDQVEIALARERAEGSNVLFPIRLDEAVLKSPTDWADRIRKTRHIGDFTQWKGDASFKTGLDRLLRDLRGEPSKPS